MARFSRDQALRFGWTTAKRYVGSFAGILVVAGLISAAPQVVQQQMGNDGGFLSALLVLALSVVSVITSIGLTRVSLTFADGGQAGIAALFADAHLFFRYLFGQILYGLIVAAGFILLVVPGIMWSFKYLFTGLLIVDKGLRPVEALRQGAALTQGARLDLFVFSLFLVGINILGALALVVGLLWTVPATLVATAHVYRQLQRTPVGSA